MIRTDAPRRRRGGDDRGFSLIEVTVAVAIISVVMLGLGAVFVATAAGTDAQGLRQVAARVATDGLDRAHALTGAAVVKGRDATSVSTQWSGRPAGVTSLLSGLTPLVDSTAAAKTGTVDCLAPTLKAGTPCASLPTSVTTTIDKIDYTQSFYVTGCQLDTAGSCLPAVGTGTVPMYDVVVSVGWRDKGCPNNACTYQLSTLLSANTTDPLFNTNYTPVGPVIKAVTQNVVQDVTELAAGPTISFDGGNGGVTLSASGLPAEVTLDPTTGVFTGNLTTVNPGTTVTVTATDRFNLFSSTTFTWTVNPLPAITSAALPVVTGLLVNTNLADLLKLTGGTGPYTWACTGLPTGLTVDPTTGVLSGLTAVLGLLTPSCTVTDARGKSANATLSLGVTAPVAALAVTSPTNGATATLTRITTVSTTLTASGCSGTCTWSATNLPSGVSLNATTGVVSGRSTVTGSFRITFTVRDTAGRSAASTVTWNVIL